MRHPRLTSAGLTIWDVPEACLAVDIMFAGRRVWTVEIAEVALASEEPVPWPEALVPYLSGHTAASVADSATGEILWHDDVRFSDEDHVTTVERPDGVPLSVNKWGLLAPELASMSEAVITTLLGETQRIIEFLEERSMRPFIVGGTLLGAVRSETLLPHDDDVDIAFLSHHTHPALVAAETLALSREFVDAGYEVVEHSAAHLQLVFRDELATPVFHIDVFAAFFSDDGHINQPFHIRGPFTVDQMLPFGEATLHGTAFPAPADVESWLVMNYDENWRTPIPGFKFETPEATSRRFENWFGGFNFKREFWDAWYSDEPGNATMEWATGQRWLERLPFETSFIVDVGCGAGHLSHTLSERHPGKCVHGIDFSRAARIRARAAAPEAQSSATFSNANLSRLSTLLAPRRAGHTGAFDVVANHVLEQISHRARANTLRLMRLALRSGGNAYATAYASFASDVSPDDPTTWHLEQEALEEEAAVLGMGVSFANLLPAPGEASRHPYGAVFSLERDQEPDPELPQKAGIPLSLSSRFRALFSRASGPTAAEALSEISELRAEVDELRHDSLRVAELLDLFEEKLVPGAEATQ